MKILNESAFKKIIFLLIYAALMGTCIGSAAATATATQGQAGYISFDNGVVTSGLGQQQYASILNGDGTITQSQQIIETFSANPQSGVERMTVRMSEAQSVDIPSVDGSTSNNPTSNEVRTLNTDDSGYIDASQEQTETLDGDFSQQQDASLKVTVTPNGKVHAKLHLKQK